MDTFPNSVYRSGRVHPEPSFRRNSDTLTNDSIPKKKSSYFVPCVVLGILATLLFLAFVVFLLLWIVRVSADSAAQTTNVENNDQTVPQISRASALFSSERSDATIWANKNGYELIETMRSLLNELQRKFAQTQQDAQQPPGQSAFPSAFGSNKNNQDGLNWPDPSLNPLGKYWKGAVAADHGLCSEMGRDVLIRGGNAVDASVPVAICIGVMNPHSAGIGGGHFMTFYDSRQKKCKYVNARETAPGAATEDMFTKLPEGSSLTGWKAIAVPGNIHGLYTAYKQFGSGIVSWRDLVMPVVQLLRNGVPVSVLLAKHLNDDDNRKHILEQGSTLDVFINQNSGRIYRVGDVMYRPALLNALLKLANASDPIQLFYDSSEMTDGMVEEIRNGGGIITHADFANYKSRVGDDDGTVMYVDLPGNLRACSLPPPSSGATTMALINVMAGYLSNGADYKSVDGQVDIYHKFIEGMKFAFADRSRFGDIDYVSEALDLAKMITRPEYAEVTRSKILNRAQPFKYYGADFANKDDVGTSHISILDQEGNAVSLTTTINIDFGSKRRSRSTGIIWNCHMDDFSTPGLTNSFGILPPPTNFIAPGKRPQSSMSPIVIYNKQNGRVRLVVGAQGGTRIISTTAYVTMRALWMNETVKEAVDAPRLHNQLAPFQTLYEVGFPELLVTKLEERGQEMKHHVPWSISQAIEVEPHLGHSRGHYIWAASDRRKSVASFPAGF